MTVAELIAALEALGPEAAGLDVHASVPDWDMLTAPAEHVVLHRERPTIERLGNPPRVAPAWVEVVGG